MARFFRMQIVLLAVAAATATLAASEMGTGIFPAQRSSAPALPAGWHMRIDDPSAPPDAVRVEGGRNGLHIVSGPAALFYRGEKVQDSFVAAARFTQPKPAPQPSGYGLFVGGSALDGATPSYTAFLIRQDGQFAIFHHDGAQTRALVDWTAHAAIFKERKPGEPGDTRDRRDERGRRGGDRNGGTDIVNVLEIDAEKNTVRFLVNGAEVVSLGAADVATSGMLGVRVQANLDVTVEGPEVRQ